MRECAMLSSVMGLHTDESILGALEGNANADIAPLHMPGHKRNEGMLGDALPWRLDITEVEGFDNLHDADGLLHRAMARAASLYGSRRTFYAVNGSTCALLAAVRAMTRRGDKVLVARNCHRAVYHALELCGLHPTYLMPPTTRAGIWGSIDLGAMEAALEVVVDVRLCVLTSPTYEGVLSDIRSIAELLHARGIALLVDEAHGAHLGLSDAFPQSAVRLGADMVVQSLHKTLPALTQTALLHVLSERVDDGEVARQLSIFETSSPSYVLMASIDQCVSLMAARGEALLNAHKARLDRFRMRTEALDHLRVMTGDVAFFALDPSKLVILTDESDATGEVLMGLLRARGFELEMAMPGYALAMTSICDEEGVLDRFADALLDIDGGLLPSRDLPMRAPLPEPVVALRIDDALGCPSEIVPFGRAAGRIAQEYAWLYPPGVPLLAPGEVVDAAFIESIEGGMVHSTLGQMPEMLRVCVLNSSQHD